LGFAATCNVGGAGKWQTSYNASLKDRDVIIIPDGDEPGRKHAEDVAANLKGHAKSIKTIQLPEKDLSAWVEAGGTADDLKRIMTEPIDFVRLTGSKPQLVENYLPDIEESVDYVIEPVAIAGGLTQLHGEPKSGKSCLSLYLGLVAATGADVPGEFITCASPVPVLYLAFEDGPRRLKRRILDYMAGLDMPGCYPPEFRLWIKPDMDVATSEGQYVLIEAIKESKSKLVVIDTISHVHKAEENSSSEMKTVMSALSRVARETNSAVMYVHHSNKATGDSAKSAIYKGRGSSAIVAAADVVLDWGRPENNVTKCELISKDDDGQKWNFHYQTLSEGISWKMSIQDKESIAPTDFKILEALRNICLEHQEGIIASQLAQVTGLSKQACGRGLERLAKKGDALFVLGKNRSKIYRPSGV